jgi:hypothetical protein
MTYKVSAEIRSTKFPATEHEIPEEALAIAVELMTNGIAHVEIVDPTGRRFTPAEFAHDMARERKETDRDDG